MMKCQTVVSATISAMTLNVKSGAAQNTVGGVTEEQNGGLTMAEISKVIYTIFVFIMMLGAAISSVNGNTAATVLLSSLAILTVLLGMLWEGTDD